MITFVIIYSANLITKVLNYIPTNCLVECWPFTGNANDESGNNRKFNS